MRVKCWGGRVGSEEEGTGVEGSEDVDSVGPDLGKHVFYLHSRVSI